LWDENLENGKTLQTMFSTRTPDRLEPNLLTLALHRLRAEGAAIVDLTASNPTQAGIDYPDDLLAPLADRVSVVYEPEPFGLPAARAAVAADYGRRGLAIDPRRIVLTASTSEAYAFLFKLLCGPGDEVLVPRPGYPLFEYLTVLEGVRAVAYGLEYHGCWRVDRESLERAVSGRTRAVLVVNPNNPTGSFLAGDDLRWIAGLCADRELALVGDEVFADFTLDGSTGTPVSVLEQRDALTFGLGGLSKSAGLPQLKLGWMAVSGPDRLVEEALARLETICDTYLSVATPVQHAAGRLLQCGAAIRDAIHQRVRRNDRALRRAASAVPAVDTLRAEGGWYGVLRVPAGAGEEALVLDLLERDRVLVHPGYFFDFPHEAFLVVSLLPPPEPFDAGIERVLSRLGS
jgi:aspartate/methionine/tyrosine aminotransferase